MQAAARLKCAVAAGLLAAHGLADELDAMGSLEEAVQDGVSDRRVPQCLKPEPLGVVRHNVR
jgi:hypothetical protein